VGTSINKIAAIAALTSLIWPTVASPQGATGGLQVNIGVNSSLKVDDNLKLNPTSNGTTFFSDTKLTFGLSSITPDSSFTLSGSTILRVGDIPGRSLAGLEDQNLQFGYARSSSNSTLKVDARYRHVDREFIDPFQVEREEQTFGSLVGGGGIQTNSFASLNFQTGLNDPIGYSVTLSTNDKSFTGVVNPAIFGTRTDIAKGSVSFAVSPVTKVSLNGGLTWFKADDAVQTDRVTRDLSVGLAQEVGPSLRFDASLGTTTVETDRIGGTTRTSGTTGSIQVTRDVRDGNYNLSLSRTVNQNGGRTTVQIGRSLDLPTGTLSANVGLTRGDTGNNRSTANILYKQQLQTSSYSVSLNRSISTNNASQDVLDTRLALNYGYEIDSQSRIDMTLDYGITEDAGNGTLPTVQRTNLRASYTRALTSDWNLQGGVLIRRINDDAAVGPAQSNSLFVTVDRNFSFRP
jgi:hypothetical protein